MFTDFAHEKKKGKENEDFFIWTLNNKITGSIFRKKKYGWVFFFSQISEDNETLFHKLDWLVEKFIKRNNVSSNQRIKRFTKTYKEIKYNLHQTKYIPNYDNFNQDDMSDFLKNILKKDTEKLNDNEIVKVFQKNIYKSMKDMEKDTQNFS